MSAAAPRLLVFGGAVMDFVAGPEGWQARPGGSAWNVALGLAGLGAGAFTAFVGALGDDPFAEQLAVQGQRAGLNLSFAARVRANTALSVIHRAQPAHYTFYDQGGADSAFAGLDSAAWENVEAAYFGGVSLLRSPANAAFVSSAEEANRRGVLVCYDPNFRSAYADQQRRALPLYLPHTRLLKVSEEDLSGLFPGRRPHDTLLELRHEYPQLSILLTLGQGGAQLLEAAHSGSSAVKHPGFVVDVADPVGAGDACIAGLLYATVVTPQLAPAERLAFAQACGALTCTRRGAYAPSLQEVVEFQH